MNKNVQNANYKSAIKRWPVLIVAIQCNPQPRENLVLKTTNEGDSQMVLAR